MDGLDVRWAVLSTIDRVEILMASPSSSVMEPVQNVPCAGSWGVTAYISKSGVLPTSL